MDGIAPHAGLFSTAADVARFGQSLLTGAALRLVGDDLIRRFTMLRTGLPGPWAYGVRVLGGDPLFGGLLSSQAFGATGFTSTMLAVDPERALAVVLLTNRVHPTRENRGIFAARGLVLDAVSERLLCHPSGGTREQPTTTDVPRAREESQAPDFGAVARRASADTAPASRRRAGTPCLRNGRRPPGAGGSSRRRSARPERRATVGVILLGGGRPDPPRARSRRGRR